MRDKPLSAQEYDGAWIASAWGEAANQALLSGAPIEARPRLQRAVDLSQLESGIRLLDIACGRGEFVTLAGYAGVQAHGIDFSRDALEFAAQVQRVHTPKIPPSGGIHLRQADATNLPFEDGSFDRITMLDIIEHLNDQQQQAMFKEVWRLLSPTGVAVIHTLPNRWVYDVTFPLLHRISGKLPKNPRGPFDSKVHINEQSVPQLAKMLDRCGLQHKLWLEQLMPAQARWNAGRDSYGDNRDHVYPLLAGVAGRVLEALSLTPMKLLLSNDIFGLAWKSDHKPDLSRTKLNLTERALMALV